VVLAELAGGVAKRLEQLSDGGIFLLQAHGGAGHADLGEARADRVLPRDETGAASGAALLGIVVGEGDAFLGDAVDVGRLVAHQAHAEMADVGDADIIAPQDQDVGFLGHGGFLRSHKGPTSVAAGSCGMEQAPDSSRKYGGRKG